MQEIRARGAKQKRAFKYGVRKTAIRFPRLLEGDETGYFTDAHKSSARKQEAQNERSSNIAKNLGAKRNLFEDDDNDQDE